MVENPSIPVDFDLEEFQRQVNYELIHSFNSDPFEEFPIDLPEGEKVYAKLGRDLPMDKKAPPPPKIKFLTDLTSLVAITVLLLLGFLLGGGNLLIPSTASFVVTGLSLLLIIRASIVGWENWKETQRSKKRWKKWKQERQEEEDRREIALQQAKEILAQNEVKAKLCPMLKGLSSSAFGLSKSILGTLVTIYSAEQLTVPLEPLVFAGAIVLLAEAGIDQYCKDNKK